MKKTARRILAILLAGILMAGAGAVTAGANTVGLGLKRFIYSPSAGSGSNRTVPIEANWGPALLSKPATAERWDPDLLWLTSILAENAYFQRLDGDPNPRFYDAGKGDTRDTLAALGFTGIDCKKAAGEKTGDIEHFNYVTFGQQTMNIGGQDYQVVAVMLRGTIDPEEWVSNFCLPDNLYVAGFHSAEQAVLAELQIYLAAHATALPRKLLITGHSRGAGVANLLGADLNANSYGWLGAGREDIYVYTFAAPNVAKESLTGKLTAPGIHTNIWNFVNPMDLVPQIPPVKWGYGKFGTTVTMPKGNEVEPLFEKYSGFAAKHANDGANVALLADALGLLSQNYYNSTIFPRLKPIIQDVFKRDGVFTYIDLEKLNEKSGSFINALIGTEVDFQELYTKLKSSALRVIVHQHTPETYVARAKVLNDPHIERIGDLTSQPSLNYSWFLGKDEATFKFVGAHGKVTWSYPSGKDRINVAENGDNTITVTSKKTTSKFGYFTGRLGFNPVSFTIGATDENGTYSEQTVKINMPWFPWLFGLIPFVGWITFTLL